MDTSIHMLMVFMDLGVVWINNDCQVVDTVLAKSWRPAYFPKRRRVMCWRLTRSG